MKKKVLHLGQTDTGGAGKAALRLCLAQRQAGWDSSMLVLAKRGHSLAVKQFYPRGGWLHRLVREFRIRNTRGKMRRSGAHKTRPGYPFSPWSSAYRSDLEKAIARADIIHLHWVAGFLHFPSLNSPLLADKTLVWTLHDFYPVTGGCHYPGDCDRFQEGCGCCPVLDSNRKVDLATIGWHMRRNVYAGIGENLIFTAPSNWLVKQAARSGVVGSHKVELLRNTLDMDYFRPHERNACRKMLGLPADRPLVLFVSDQPDDLRKGGDLIKPVLHNIRQGLSAHFVSVGKDNAFPDISDHTALGAIADDRLLGLVYAAADVFILPSRDDNLPNTVIEALSCGTPVVCFSAGGAPEMLVNGQNGAVVDRLDPGAMAEAVIALVDEKESAHIRNTCRANAEAQVGSTVVLDRCQHIYNSIASADIRA